MGPSADGEGFEARVAERARERGAEAFDLLQLDPSEAAGWEPQPDFDLCLWRSGVGRLADAQVVLERVAACLRPGGSLVLFETLPLPAEDGALAAHELSQRLWQLMPERYKHNHRLGTLQLRGSDAPAATCGGGSRGRYTSRRYDSTTKASPFPASPSSSRFRHGGARFA